MKANLIRAKMAENGVTQRETAKAIGVSENSLSRKLNGKREFSLSEVCALCEYLEILNPSDIFLDCSSHIRNNDQQAG